MCLILLAIKKHPVYDLILLANRDEFYERPTAPAHFWEDSSSLLAGKDLRAKGTWLGVTRDGRIAAVTNYRDPASIKDGAPSRGWLVRDFLRGHKGLDSYLGILEEDANNYNGFSLILGDKEGFHYYSNIDSKVRDLSPGIYGLSNHLLDTPWPKVLLGKELLEQFILNKGSLPVNEAFEILGNRDMPDDRDLPDTGVGLEWERRLSPVFITSPDYGTRSSTLLFIDRNDHVTFIEKTYDSDHDGTIVRYEFNIQH